MCSLWTTVSGKYEAVSSQRAEQSRVRGQLQLLWLWVFHVPYCQLLCTDLIFILFFELTFAVTHCDSPPDSYLMCLLHSYPVETIVYLCFVSLRPSMPWGCYSHMHTHTHMGLVKPCSNPERLESRGRSLGLGPLQLATGSHDSNKRVASQLQGTVMLFSPKEPDWRKMNNYGLRDWMNDYSSAVF